jgi:hypothetical protein
MSPSALPWIEEADYPRFQRMIAELQKTSFEEWTEDHEKAVAYRRSRNGSTNVPITPEEFDAWLKENNETAHMELLWVFAEDKAAGVAKV